MVRAENVAAKGCRDNEAENRTIGVDGLQEGESLVMENDAPVSCVIPVAFMESLEGRCGT